MSIRLKTNKYLNIGCNEGVVRLSWNALLCCQLPDVFDNWGSYLSAFLIEEIIQLQPFFS